MPKLILLLKVVTLGCSILLTGVGAWLYIIKQQVNILESELELIIEKRQVPSVKNPELLSQNLIALINAAKSERKIDVPANNLDNSPKHDVTIIYGDDLLDQSSISPSEFREKMYNMFFYLGNKDIFDGHRIASIKEISTDSISFTGDHKDDVARIYKRVKIDTPFYILLFKDRPAETYSVLYMNVENNFGSMLDFDTIQDIDFNLLLGVISLYYNNTPDPKLNIRMKNGILRVAS